jgi:hypothetical protein
MIIKSVLLEVVSERDFCFAECEFILEFIQL